MGFLGVPLINGGSGGVYGVYGGLGVEGGRGGGSRDLWMGLIGVLMGFMGFYGVLWGFLKELKGLAVNLHKI